VFDVVVLVEEAIVLEEAPLMPCDVDCRLAIMWQEIENEISLSFVG